MLLNQLAKPGKKDKNKPDPDDYDYVGTKTRNLARKMNRIYSMKEPSRKTVPNHPPKGCPDHPRNCYRNLIITPKVSKPEQ